MIIFYIIVAGVALIIGRALYRQWDKGTWIIRYLKSIGFPADRTDILEVRVVHFTTVMGRPPLDEEIRCLALSVRDLPQEEVAKMRASADYAPARDAATEAVRHAMVARPTPESGDRSAATRDVLIGAVPLSSLCRWAMTAKPLSLRNRRQSNSDLLRRESHIVHYAAVDWGVLSAKEQGLIDDAGWSLWCRLRRELVTPRVSGFIGMQTGDFVAAVNMYQQSLVEATSDGPRIGAVFSERTNNLDIESIVIVEIAFVTTCVATIKCFRGELTM